MSEFSASVLVSPMMDERCLLESLLLKPKVLDAFLLFVKKVWSSLYFKKIAIHFHKGVSITLPNYHSDRWC